MLVTTGARIPQLLSPPTGKKPAKRPNFSLLEPHFPNIFLTSSVYSAMRPENSAHCKYVPRHGWSALPAFSHPRGAHVCLSRPRFGRNLKSVSLSCHPRLYMHHQQQHTRGLLVTANRELRSFSRQHLAKWTFTGGTTREVPGSIFLAPTLAHTYERKHR